MAWTLPEDCTGLPDRPDRLCPTAPDEALKAKIRAALDEWVVRMSYNIVYENEDGDEPTVSDDIRYKDVREEYIVVKHGEPVGVLLEEIVYYHNSNCTDTHLYVLYFRDAPDRNLMLEGARIGNRSVEGYCFFSLRRRTEMPQGATAESASSEFFPVPKVYC